MALVIQIKLKLTFYTSLAEFHAKSEDVKGCPYSNSHIKIVNFFGLVFQFLSGTKMTQAKILALGFQRRGCK
jgi:hypothetical protein